MGCRGGGGRDNICCLDSVLGKSCRFPTALDSGVGIAKPKNGRFLFLVSLQLNSGRKIRSALVGAALLLCLGLSQPETPGPKPKTHILQPGWYSAFRFPVLSVLSFLQAFLLQHRFPSAPRQNVGLCFTRIEREIVKNIPGESRGLAGKFGHIQRFPEEGKLSRGASALLWTLWEGSRAGGGRGESTTPAPELFPPHHPHGFGGTGPGHPFLPGARLSPGVGPSPSAGRPGKERGGGMAAGTPALEQGKGLVVNYKSRVQHVT